MIKWAADFTKSNFGFSWGVQEKASDRAASVADPLGVYDHVGRVHVAVGDNNVANSGEGERCEALIPGGGVSPSATAPPMPMYGVEGSEEWWAHGVFFDATFKADEDGWGACTQWHNSGSTGGTTGYVVAGSNITFHVFGGDPSHSQRHDFALIPDRKNMVPYEFVTHVKWSSDPAVGFIEILGDGKVLVPKTPCATLYQGETVYFKQGYYRDPDNYDAILYYYGTCYGDAMADVVAKAFPKSSKWGSTPPTPPPPPAETAKVLIGKAENELAHTTITYPDWKNRVDSGYYAAKKINPATGTGWGRAFAYLDAAKSIS